MILVLLLELLRPVPFEANAAATGAVKGVIADNVGGPLAYAQVVLRHPDGTVAASTETRGMGFYRFEMIPAGPYVLVASHPEYAPGSQRLRVVAAREAVVSLMLRARK